MASNKSQDFIEDVHICGACREEFHDVELFIVHKRTGCPQFAKRLQCQQSQLISLSTGKTVGLPSSVHSQLGQVVLTQMSPETNLDQNSLPDHSSYQTPQSGINVQPNIVSAISTQSILDSHTHTSLSQISQPKVDLIQVQQGQEIALVPSHNKSSENCNEHSKSESIHAKLKVHTGTSASSFVADEFSSQQRVEVQQGVTDIIKSDSGENKEELNEQNKKNINEQKKESLVPVIQEGRHEERQSDFVTGNVMNTMTTSNNVACNPMNISRNNILTTSVVMNAISSAPFISTGYCDNTHASVSGFTVQSNHIPEVSTASMPTVLGNQSPQITLDLASFMNGLVPLGLSNQVDGGSAVLSCNTEQSNQETTAAGTPSGTIQITLSPGANNVTVLTQNLPATIQAALQAGLGQILSQNIPTTPITANIEAGKPSSKEHPGSNTSTSSFKKVRYETYNIPADRPKIITVAPKKYQCDYKGCGYSTSYQKDLERHQRIHTGEKPYECSLCGKAYNRSDKLRIHERNHSGLKPYKCQHCEYSTSDSSSLKKHLRIHTDERPFRCQICPYASRNSSQLIVHLRTHTGDCPFVCHICNAKFKINSDLKRHMRLHTGEKPYKCDICDYKCAIKGNLKSHYRINHSQDNMVTCKDCGYQTSSRKAYREHLKSHEPNYHYSCQYCAYTCVSRATLRTHLRIHSDEKPYRCDYCNYATKQSGNVKMHMKRRHPGKCCNKGTGKGKDKNNSQSMNSPTCAVEDHIGPATPHKQVTPVISAIAPQISEFSQSEDAINKRATNIRPVCKKMFKCPQCDLSFVREDSLRCHLRCHKETDSVIAQAVENAAFAVLQLQHPISNISRKENEVAEGEGVNPLGEGDHSYQECVVSDTSTMNGQSSVTPAGSETSEAQGSQQEGNQILQTALSQSNINPIAHQQTQQLPQQVTHHPLKTAMPITSTTSLHHQANPAMAVHSEHHQDSLLNQAANNLMAFMQNNQNMAVEDNIQNHAISRQQIAQSRIDDIPFSSHTINHHPVQRINEHHYAHQSLLHSQNQQRYSEDTMQAPTQHTHQSMGRPINLSMGTSGIPLNVHIMGGATSTTSQAPSTCSSQPIQFILPIQGSVPMAMANNTPPMDTSVISVPQQLVLNVDGQRTGYNQSRALAYTTHQQPSRESFASAVSNGNHLIDIPPPIATVDFSSLASPPSTTAKGAK